MSQEISCYTCFNKIPTEEQKFEMMNGKYLCESCIEKPKFLCHNCRTLKSSDTEMGIVTDNIIMCKVCLEIFAMHYLKQNLQKPKSKSLDELFWNT